MPDHPPDLSKLAAWVKARDASKPRKDRNLVAFLAVRDYVKAALESGYAMQTIWEYLCDQKSITSSYDTFIKQCRRHLKNTEHRQAMEHGNKKKTETPIEQVTPPDQTTGPNEPQSTPKSTMSGFTFNPIPDPEKLF